MVHISGILEVDSASVVGSVFGFWISADFSCVLSHQTVTGFFGRGRTQWSYVMFDGSHNRF